MQSEPLNFQPGVRFVQTYWSGKNKWFIGLAMGASAGIPEEPKATVGDRLVVYTPRYVSREKSFWETQPQDLEESWRSEILPGRVLDVRIGDPKNDGKIGILVLTADKNTLERRLHFYGISEPGAIR